MYYNDAGTMMDRNLGATSATPGDVGALGLMYQWGRKDPFMGSSSISSSTVLAVSTGTWNITSGGSTLKAEANPMTFYASMSLPNGSWESTKTAYDPCPAGWRVPEGGEDGVWAKALGSSASVSVSFDSSKKGINFTGIYGEAECIWYPASSRRDYTVGSLDNVGVGGHYWSASPVHNSAYNLFIKIYEGVRPSDGSPRAYGYSVRCLQETK